MIERFYAKNLIGFNTIDLEFSPGLVVITGPSGAGKSVFLAAILALFGLDELKAQQSEIVLKKESVLNLDSYDAEDEIVTVRGVKKEKARYFLNDLTISKRRLKELMEPLVWHIAQRENKELSSEFLLDLVDAMATFEEKEFMGKKESYCNLFEEYRKKLSKLEKMQSDKSRVEELIEFTEFEISKIDEVSPKVGEDNELMAIKRKLSRKEKIDEALLKASRIFEIEQDVHTALELLDADSVLFDEAMNMLRGEFERAKELLDELEELDVESILNRIESIASLKKKYGSIEEAIEYRNKKLKELEYYKNLNYEFDDLKRDIERVRQLLESLAEELSLARKEACKGLQNFINDFLLQLKMPPLSLTIEKKSLDMRGKDRVSIDLQGSSINTLSGGEFNRVRLALLLCKSELLNAKGILLIDEIDANVSGDESIAIAKLLKRLSKGYQIIAISHQPHLSAAANEHILVTKEGESSIAKSLKKSERVKEISRMIAGENSMQEASELAKRILKEFL